MHQNVYNVKAGDVVRYDYGDYNHYITVIAADSVGIAFVDCNGGSDVGACQIGWDRWKSKADLSARNPYVYVAPYDATVSDSVAPTISSVSVTDIQRDGYTVNCTVEDNLGLFNVKFPTWTFNNDQDDIVWGTADVSGTSANVSYRVNRSDHNNEFGDYVTHIYVYDMAGNYSMCAITSTINMFDYRDYVDVPTEGSSYIDKALTISGWSISMSNSVEKIQYSLNGGDWTNAERHDRMDVRNSFPDYPGGNEGFAITVDKSRLVNGTNTVAVKTVYKDGQERVVGIKSFTANHDYMPNEVFEYGGNMYCVYNDVMNWSNARDLCKNLGGHIVTINNENENKEITSHLNGKRYWIGLNDVDSEGNFVWSEESSSTYRNFSEGEPNNSADNEDCCAIYGNGKWNDLADSDGDNALVGFILEIEGTSIDLGSTKFFGNSMYEFYNNKLPFSAAEFFARLNGGNLVTINSAAENSFIKDNITETNWLGINDTKTEGVFGWITNETLDYINWNDGEPNNSDGIEDYGCILADGTWNDVYNHIGYSYIIEYPADINQSGKNDKVDATMLLKHLSNTKYLTDEQYLRADINGDGGVNMLDIIEILKNNT